MSTSAKKLIIYVKNFLAYSLNMPYAIIEMRMIMDKIFRLRSLMDYFLRNNRISFYPNPPENKYKYIYYKNICIFVIELKGFSKELIV